MDLVIRLARWYTWNANISLNILAHDLRWAACWTCDVDAFQMDAVASSAWAASEIGNDLAVLTTACAVDVQEVDVGDVDFAWVRGAGCVVDVEVALVQNDGGICVLDVDVLVGDVIDISVANVWTSPGLETSAVLAVEQSDILQPCIGDVVLDTGVLADGTHGDTMSAVTPEILDEDVGSVGLGAKAVIANIDTGVGHSKTIDVERVETIRVLW